VETLAALKRRITQSQVALDGLLALAVAATLVAVRAAEAQGLRDPHHVAWLGYLLAVVAAGLLAARRRWPFVVFSLTLAIAVVAIDIDYASGAVSLPALIAVYTLAELPDRRRSLALAAVAAVTLGVARGLLQHKGWSDARTAAEPALVFMALFLGWALASHRAYIAEINERAARAERTREEEASRQVNAERLRIARELHDVVAHSIAMINVQASAAAHVLSERPEAAAEALATIKAASKDSLRELRSILGVLRDNDETEPRAPAPGLGQLDGLVAAMRNAGVPTSVNYSGTRRSLPPSADLAAYRIIQESLTNVLRHAGPTAAVVSITFERDRVTVDVEDGGCPHGERTAADGHGIRGMRERAVALGGALEVGCSIDGGFRVHATLPIRGPA
jgi:signal transduction histidine kinase